jgi:DNA mismatch endonuclease (patch repair protein)
LLASMGLKGWRQNAVDVIGKPDVAFPSRKVAIFIDGCFWHGCPTCKRPLPTTNRAYWQRKIQRNVMLAKSYNRALRRSGWTVLRIWEHEMANTNTIRARIIKALQPKGR